MKKTLQWFGAVGILMGAVTLAIYLIGIIFSIIGSFIMWTFDPLIASIQFDWLLGQFSEDNFWQDLRTAIVVLFAGANFVLLLMDADI